MASKYVLEFGKRGGAYTDNLVMPTAKLGTKTAAAIAYMLGGPGHVAYWDCGHEPRRVWQSPTHFVALSKLDGVDRGPASAALWYVES